MKDCDKFEKLVEEDQIHFHPAGLNDLDEWGRALARTFLENIPWKLGDVKVGQSYCLKVDDDMIGYLDIYPETEQFMWCTPDHHDSFHPDVASAYLITRNIPGAKARCIIDDITGLRTMEIRLPDGRGVRVKDVEKDGVRVFAFEPF